MSKKEKRKAKKKGIAEEPSLDQEPEIAPEPTTVAPKEVEVPAPTPAEPKLELTAESKVPTESEFTKQPEPETSKEIESAAEPQPAAEPETVAEPEPIVTEPLVEEPEPALSRKSSKKKAKKARKASLALDVEPAADKQEAAVSLEPEESAKAPEVELPESATQEPKQDEDEWPTIEWEQDSSDKPEPTQAQVPEPEPMTSVPETETIGDFDESAIPAALQETTKEAEEGVEEETWSVPLSKKDKKKAKKNKRKSEQAALAEFEEPAQEPSHKKIELAPESQPEPTLEATAPKEIEIEPPVRSVTPGGSKIANLFPGLERGGFGRTTVNKQSPSLKDSAEEETAADLEANRDIAIPVSEAPIATSETHDDASVELPTEDKREESVPSTTDQDALAETVPVQGEFKEITVESELPVHVEQSIEDYFPSPLHPASKKRSSMLFGSSPSARTEEASSPRHLLPSQIESVEGSSCGLRRTPSIIHGQHQQTPRTWNLEEQSIQAVRTPSPPRSLFEGPFGEHDAHSPPRTPLDTIAEQEPVDANKATTAPFGTPRLEVKPEHVLPRPVTPVRKFTDNALARESWPTSENDSGSSQDDSKKSPILKTPEEGMPVLKPSISKGKLRRANRSTSGDLRSVSRSLDSQPPRSDLDHLPSSSSYDPVTEKGKRPVRNMSDVYVSDYLFCFLSSSHFVGCLFTDFRQGGLG